MSGPPRPPGAIVDASAAPPGDLTVDICIVGSGAGGGTAARLLAEAGREVLVLEEGGDFTGERMTQRDGEMYDQLYMDRGGRATDDLSVSVLQGRVLGGGPVINACDVVPIPEAVLRHWQRRFGLAELRSDVLAPHLQATLADLSAGPIADEQVNKANALLRAGAQKLGLRGEVMHHNRVGCLNFGTCLIGCPADAKQTPRNVAIPKAIAAGARFLIRARAVRIEGAQQEMKRVHVRTLDARGYHETGDLTVRARTVIVAANAVASAQLLLRSGIGNSHVGQHLMLQPQLPIVAVFPERVDAVKGIPQAFAITQHEVEDHPEYGLWGFRIEAVMGTPGIVASLLPSGGNEGKEAMTRYGHFAASLLLVPDEPSGSVTLKPSGRPLIRYTHRENHKARLREAIRVAARVYLAAGAERVDVASARPLTIRKESDLAQVDALRFDPATVALISAHQQGTARMAPRRADGAMDPDGRIYGTRGVYVLDSSAFPTSASSHTMTPIMTLSRYLTHKLLSQVPA